MNAQCFAHLTEATLSFPNMYDEGRSVTEIDLWGPETITAMPGAAAWVRGEDAYNDIATLMIESGMHWDYGPYRAAVLAHIDEMEEWEEHGTAYEKWCSEDTNMDDLHEPSYFLEWNHGEGAATWVGGGELHKNRGKVPKFTPEMLLQRDMLNWNFNHEWNKPEEERDTEGWVLSHWATDEIPDQCENLELVAVGDNHGVAKCMYGAVYIPKSGLKYLLDTGYLFGGGIGSQFKGHIKFTPFQKFPWRLKKDGITHSIAACEDYYYDDY